MKKQKMNNAVKIFRQFLRQRNAWQSYVLYTRENALHPFYPTNLQTSSPTAFLNCAFSWSLTPQGHNYWYQINEEWVNFLISNPQVCHPTSLSSMYR